MTTCRALIVAMVAGGLAAGCAKEEAYEKPLTPVQVRAVTPSAAAEGVRYSASVEPNVRVDLAFKAGGYIQQLAKVGGRDIQDGDSVTRGMVLARIRVTDYAEKVKQARSQLAEAEAASAQVSQAYERATQLYQARSITKPELEQAQAAYDTVKARMSGARALVQEAENAQNDTALVSPIDGVVLKRLIEVGSLVGPGSGGFVLADTSSVKVVFGAPDTMLATLKPGTIQTVTSEAVPNREFQGRITKIAPTADPRSRVFDVEITMPNRDGALKVGMVAVVQLGTSPAAAASTLAVPLSAIVRSKDKSEGYAVYVVEETGGNAVARIRDVMLGDMVGNQVAVTGGVRAGERVIVSGATIVTDGERVRIVL
jgi:multidrug efflux system membrane fusion protein